MRLYYNFFIYLFLSTFTTLASYSLQEIEWLEKNSMLYQSTYFSQIYSGKKLQWEYPYGLPNPEAAIKLGSVWFTAYPMSIITQADETILQTLGNPKLWDIFEEIGIQGIHTGPMKISGGIQGKSHTSTVDGYFDRISFHIDPSFGTHDQYVNMVKEVHQHHSIVIGDLIPGHTGLGYDFQLALRGYKEYPGIYHIVEVDPKDWNFLPEVPFNSLSVNLSLSNVEILKEQGYIVGPLQSIMFYDPKEKVSNWNATRPIEGADGKIRRWVYLHYFKAGQPSLNWLDPSFGTQKIIAADIIQSIHFLNNQMLRLDANPFLGVEISQGKAWSENHPLTIASSDLISMMIRKVGGFSFQELNMSIDDIRTLSELGSDLTYDFITRAAYMNALVNQDVSFLYLMIHLMKTAGMPLLNFIHALQNHDEFNYDLVQFITHKDTEYRLKDQKISGSDLRKQIRKHDLRILSTPHAPYNPIFDSGIASTMVGLCAAALEIPDVYNMTFQEKENVKQAHLLFACFNAIQPGVFAISGWDLVGAYPLKPDQIPSFIDTGDMRWINRGGYDLLGESHAVNSTFNLPKAEQLYGPLPKQIKDPNSFASKLKTILNIRKEYKIDLSVLKECPRMHAEEIFITLLKIKRSKQWILLALNFGNHHISDSLSCNFLRHLSGVNLLTDEQMPIQSDTIQLNFNPLEYKIILLE